jgi:diguanylate cyclase
MAVLNINHDDLRTVILQLEQSLYNHNQWYDSLLRTLVCRLPYDSVDVEKNAHKKCRFGQWYYNHAPRELKKHPGFIAIENEHERMHELAANLLLTVDSGESIPPLDYENFNSSINNVRLQLQTLKHELEDSLYNRDSLTRAYSRIGMLTRLRELQEFVKRKVESCSIAMVDLDHFKSVNDVHGHLAGDHVLAAVASHMMANLRPYDKLFRYGGEEFLISMPHTDSQSVFEVVERLREGIAASDIRYRGKEIRITASFGLTLLDADVSVEQCIDRADRALYAAKSAGRNRTNIWAPSIGL